MSDATPVFVIDILPANCKIIAQIARFDGETPIMISPADMHEIATHVRFCAGKPDGSESEWSGWFGLNDIPIVLTWATFWDTGSW